MTDRKPSAGFWFAAALVAVLVVYRFHEIGKTPTGRDSLVSEHKIHVHKSRPYRALVVFTAFPQG